MKLPTRQIILEGSDLSGKSTFYGKLHKATGYGYDIRDRGRLSRIVYAEMYDRNLSHERDEFYRYIDDLNNVVVFLDPDWQVVSERYDVRGDEIHDRDSLHRTWSGFNRLALALSSHPSVVTCDGSPDADFISEIIKFRESVTTASLTQSVAAALESTGRNESLDMRFEVVVSPSDDPGARSLQVPGEEEYYSGIYKELLRRVESESANGQDETSRRFVATNPSCISYVRFIRRPERDVVDLICRSTNVKKNLQTDLDAIIHSAFKVQDWFDGSENRRDFLFRVQLHCAHIIP
jgi:hypothetical protein